MYHQHPKQGIEIQKNKQKVVAEEFLLPHLEFSQSEKQLDSPRLGLNQVAQIIQPRYHRLELLELALILDLGRKQQHWSVLTDQSIPETVQKMISERCEEEKEMLKKASTSKAPANFPAMSGMLTTTVSIFFFVLHARTLQGMSFLLKVDKGRLSGVRLILGPCMTEEIEGALYPIYETRLGGQ
jgi:hypothetical protein